MRNIKGKRKNSQGAGIFCAVVIILSLLLFYNMKTAAAVHEVLNDVLEAENERNPMVNQVQQRNPMVNQVQATAENTYNVYADVDHLMYAYEDSDVQEPVEKDNSAVQVLVLKNFGTTPATKDRFNTAALISTKASSGSLTEHDLFEQVNTEQTHSKKNRIQPGLYITVEATGWLAAYTYPAAKQMRAKERAERGSNPSYSDPLFRKGIQFWSTIKKQRDVKIKLPFLSSHDMHLKFAHTSLAGRFGKELGFFVSDSEEYVVSERVATSPFKFHCQHNPAEVIRGYEMGIPLLHAGDRAVVRMRSDYAYGSGGTQGIPPHSDLIFEIDVISVIDEGKS